ncbi:hypothetical protein YH63_000535 [Afipia massiliensis]|uniref:Uncharacterized protein n=1 Tax=Afipia massiliensis TaxID=211460 RepID=A0A4U6BIQ7_9BRAD|nr:hypothetical protein YH63_000535 [Afipia massiliensis]
MDFAFYIMWGIADRHCEEAEPTKQSSFLFALDCFASLAMTASLLLARLAVGIVDGARHCIRQIRRG